MYTRAVNKNEITLLFFPLGTSLEVLEDKANVLKIMLAHGFSTAQFHSSHGAHREYNSHKVADTHNTKPLQIVVVVFHAKKTLNSLTSKLLAARVDGSPAASRGEVEASVCGKCCGNTTAATDHRGGTVRDTVCSTDVCRRAMHSRSKEKKKGGDFPPSFASVKEIVNGTYACFIFFLLPFFPFFLSPFI